MTFDSQRQPYPTLAEFGFTTNAASTISPPKTPRLVLTATDVAPVVDALRQAFGSSLQLFGFDVIYGDGCLWVIDVNYFPSYKEVGNFPTLLANVLAQQNRG